MKKLFVLLLCLAPFSVSAQQSQPSTVRTLAPVIVARRSFLNQSAPLPDTTVFMSKNSDGLYRVSIYISTAPDTPAGAAFAGLSWTNEYGTQSPGYGVTADSADKVPGSGSIVIRAKAQTPIQISANQCCGGGQTLVYPYSVYVVVERLW